MAFYKLYQEWSTDKTRFVPTWEFGGEMYIKELNRWVLMSYKCPTRLTELYQENTMLERDLIIGKSGSRYFGYRLKKDVMTGDIRDSAVREFYKAIKRSALDLKAIELSTGTPRQTLLSHAQ